MAIDKLQEKIRKMKNPTMLDFNVDQQLIPEELLRQEGSVLRGFYRYSREVLDTLRGIVPAVRLHFGQLALYGSDGLSLLASLCSTAKKLGYYVALDIPAAASGLEAELMAQKLMSADCVWEHDGLIVTSYIGSDGYLPYLKQTEEKAEDVFVLTRTSNRSASELQDLLAGGRLVHFALADHLKRHGQKLLGRSGYSRLGAVGAASSADSLRNLREKYKEIFLILDGADYPNANAKNCSYAFDRLGHGAIASVGGYILGAWTNHISTDDTYLDCAREAALRMQKNLSKYVTIL